MPESLAAAPRKIPTLSFGLGIFLLLAGVGLLWWDSRQMVTIYSGSYVSLREDTFHFGPSATMLLGQLLLGLGLAGCALGCGFLLSKGTWLGRIAPWIPLGIGVLLLLAAGGLLWWDSVQVKTFGWFAYAPLSTAELHGQISASAALIFGKIALGLGFVMLGASTGLTLGRRAARRGQES
ncbi:hypothetical protein [Glutamicibacter arilaitensis]|uniref:hypothetical protein n=1 Tax=Glutamicibacter arilaitensis TaxID=256701 RepID=UPI00384DFE13